MKTLNYRDRFIVNFIEADILVNPSKELEEKGMDIVVLNLMLHQWNWKTQVGALQNVVKLTGPSSQGAGALIVGCHVGSIIPAARTPASAKTPPVQVGPSLPNLSEAGQTDAPSAYLAG